MAHLIDEKSLIDQYRHGKCYVMAIALSRTLGWEIGCLFVDVPHSEVSGGFWPHPVHAYVISPEGHFLDAGGLTDESSLTEEYLTNSFRKFINPRYVKFTDTEAFLTTLRHLEEGHVDGMPYDLEVYSKFDYDYGWSYGQHLELAIPKALEAAEILQLTDKANQPSFSM